MASKLFRLLFAIALAYPLSAVPYMIVYDLTHPENLHFMMSHPLGALFIGTPVALLWLAFLTPVTFGFPPIDEGGVMHTNMYPFIIPTAAVLFWWLSNKKGKFN